MQMYEKLAEIDHVNNTDSYKFKIELIWGRNRIHLPLCHLSCMKIFFHAKSLCEGNNSFEISATQYQEFDRNMNIHQLK